MLLPGPEAQQLATYIGWLMHRTRGGIMAGGLFVLPGVIAIMALSYVYAAYGNVGFVAALFFGLKAAVLAIVIQAVVRVGKRALQEPRHASRSRRSPSSAIFFFNVPFPLIIVAAGADRLSSAQRAGHRRVRAGGGMARRSKRLADRQPARRGRCPTMRGRASRARAARRRDLAGAVAGAGRIVLSVLGTSRTSSARSRSSSARWRW